MRVGVVGAGIGGLAAALGLRESGHEVTVLEATPELGEVGAGIQMAPNATRILHSWGLQRDLEQVSVRAETSRRLRWEDGRLLGATPLGQSVVDRYGAPYLHVHRADLHALLLKAATDSERSGDPAEIHLNQRLVSASSEPDEATATFADGSTRTFDVLIGADGIHSTVRSTLGIRDHARFSGDLAWRAVIPVEKLDPTTFDWMLSEPAVWIWLGPGQHLVHYLVRGKQLVNVVALVPGTDTTESWLRPSDPAELRAQFAHWAPRARAVLAQVEEATSSALFDRLPLETWTLGRIALLGDACHAMLPYQAQGAAQAIEDAAALVEALATATSNQGADALKEYELRRLHRANTVQAASRANREWFHMPDGHQQVERDRQIAELTGDSMVSFDWLWSAESDPEMST